jgi:Fe-S-cluster containining protein
MEMLPTGVREQIKARAQALNGIPAPIVCPFLDPERGTCLVYESRPLACRTYGFYVERDRGLYCQAIEARVDAGEYSNVVWGNQAGIDCAGSVLGPTRSLLDWFT